eukprot:TRINITY_DN17940_c0_g1_i2.p2 TRINITY_DN17940_c0_g1~~TRINITY_DN17940_c0_g1_i2.p2  ORF type:complete len:167 (+),score=32.87 TRINITY_DN17940_c0_g1_i2:532-1032(+)
MAQELARREGWPLPLKLYVSANRAPGLSGPGEDTDRASPTLHDLDAEAFWLAFERRYGRNPDLASPAIRSHVLPALRNDFRLLENYRPSTEAPLDAELVVLGARGDGRYTAEQLDAWAPCTTRRSAFGVHWFDGKQDPAYWATPHRYVTDNRYPLLRFLSEDLPRA